MTVSSINTRNLSSSSVCRTELHAKHYMKNAATAAIKTLIAPLGEIPLAELKTGDLLGIIDEEVIEPDGIVEEPDMPIEGEAVGIIIDMLDEPVGIIIGMLDEPEGIIMDMLDEPDIDSEHPPVIPPIIAPTYQITPVSLLRTGNFCKRKKEKENKT